MSIYAKTYSEKSFVILGETKPVKDKLKQLGGKYNPNLSGQAGWIFSSKTKNPETILTSIGIEINEQTCQIKKN